MKIIKIYYIKKFCFFLFLSVILFFQNSIIIHAKEINTVSLALVGDIFLGGKTGAMIKKEGPKYPFLKVASILQSADIASGNLECPLSHRGNPTKDANLVKSRVDYIFRASPKVVDCLTYAGFDILSLANNHTMDYGKTALEDTLTVLSQHKIRAVGAGRNIYEACSPRIFKINGLNVGFFAYSVILPYKSVAGVSSPGIAPGRDTSSKSITEKTEIILAQDITKTRKKVDFLVISVHWGKEFCHYPNSLQKELGHFLIDSGADLVVGHHSHVLQGIETYKGKLIAYSLGDFVFAAIGKASRQSIILCVQIGKDGFSKVELLPVFITEGQPEIVSGKQAMEILRLVKRLSSRLGTNISIEKGRALIEN